MHNSYAAINSVELSANIGITFPSTLPPSNPVVSFSKSVESTTVSVVFPFIEIHLQYFKSPLTTVTLMIFPTRSNPYTPPYNYKR